MISVAQNGLYRFQYGNIMVNNKDSSTQSGRSSGFGECIVRSGRPLVRQFNSETRARGLHIVHADGAPMLRDDSITDAQTESGAFAHWLGGVERVEHTRCVLHTRPAILEFHNQVVIFRPRADPEVSIS